MKKPRGRNLDEIIAERRARRFGQLRTALISALVLAVLVVITRRWLESRRNPDYTRARTVVVPFDNRTGDAAFDTLGLVASDWITRILSLYAPYHEVVPTTTSLRYIRSARLSSYDLLTRAQRLGRGTGAQVVVWGSFYRTGDSLRFNIEITDARTSLMIGSVPQVAAPIDSPMRAIDKLRSGVVGAILHTETMERPIGRIVPELRPYQSFVNGLDAYSLERYGTAANSFSAASADTSMLPHQVWLADALVQDRQFARADSVLRAITRRRMTRLDNARLMRSWSRIRNDAFNVYGWTSELASLNPGDDWAAFQHALSALAVGRAREARREFSVLQPGQGTLHGRPDFYLHYAAAYHLLGNHRAELSVVRNGLKARTRTIAVRLANCRVRAALGEADNARAALDALLAGDTDTTGVVDYGYAVRDCAAELDAHGHPELAARATAFADAWTGRRPMPAIVRDTFYEKGYVRFASAARQVERGDLAYALTLLSDAYFAGLPFYEPGRVMLHADPAFRRLRNTRGFLRINQPRG